MRLRPTKSFISLCIAIVALNACANAPRLKKKSNNDDVPAQSDHIPKNENNALLSEYKHVKVLFKKQVSMDLSSENMPAFVKSKPCSATFQGGLVAKDSVADNQPYCMIKMPICTDSSSQKVIDENTSFDLNLTAKMGGRVYFDGTKTLQISCQSATDQPLTLGEVKGIFGGYAEWTPKSE